MKDKFEKHQYSKSIQTISQKGREILVEHYYPTPEISGFTAQKKKIEESLYDIFQKYEGTSPHTFG